MIKPGAILVVLHVGVAAAKHRPVVVVSSDVYQAARPDVLIATLTQQVALAIGPTDYVLQDWAAAGLHRPSAFRAFLSTLPVAGMRPPIGYLSDRDWQEVQKRLRLALAV